LGDDRDSDEDGDSFSSDEDSDEEDMALDERGNGSDEHAVEDDAEDEGKGGRSRGEVHVDWKTSHVRSEGSKGEDEEAADDEEEGKGLDEVEDIDAETRENSEENPTDDETEGSGEDESLDPGSEDEWKDIHDEQDMYKIFDGSALMAIGESSHSHGRACS